MKLFQSALKKLENLGISPNQSRLNRKLVMTSISFWLDNTLNCVYLVREVNSFSEMANSIFIISTSTTISMCFTILIINKTKLFCLVDDAEKIMEQVLQMNPASKKRFEAAIHQIDKWSGITYYFITRIIPLSLILPKLVTSFCIYFTSDLGGDALELPAPTWFPFGWRNPIGYLVAVLFEYVIITCMSVFVASLLAIGIAAFLFEVTMTKEMKRDLNSINESSEPQEDNLQIMKKLTDFIENHSTMKQIMLDFSEVCQPFFIVVFTLGVVLISLSVFVIQTELRQLDFVVLIVAFFYACIALVTVLIICELAQRGCDLFNSIDKTLVQLNWYSLPNEIQRMLPLMLTVAQQPVEVVCFGSISCDRDTFKKILNKAYSWLMMLRHFNK